MELTLTALILGVVEGVTEFLPISSTGHLIIVSHYFNFSGEFANMFNVVIQLGAILSVVVYFWRRLLPSNAKDIELWVKVLVGFIPALVVGGLLGKKIEDYLFNTSVVSAALIVWGIILIWAENKSRRHIPTINNMQNLGYKTAFYIGIMQIFAMIPGTSRSAATIIGAMLLGTSRIVAVEFSFFLAIPTMFGAAAYSLMKMGVGNISPDQWVKLSIGFITSFVVALIVISFIMNYIKRHTFKPFGYYRIALGILIIILSTVKV